MPISDEWIDLDGPNLLWPLICKMELIELLGDIMKNKLDLFSLIKKDHRKVETLFSKLEKTTERATKVRSELYAKLRSELTIHSEAEESAVYPSLKENEITEEIGYESVEEHDIVKFLLSKLDKAPCDSKEWTAQMTALKEAVQHHVKEEENVMFKKIKRAFPQEQLNEMAAKFQEAKGAASANIPEGQAEAAAA